MAGTVASISFTSDRGISMDVEGVRGIAMGQPTRMDENVWCCDLIIRTDNGNIAMQMVAEAPERFNISTSIGGIVEEA